MSCNGCRVLRKGCSETCILRPCLQWIESPEAQGHATVFVAKFFGRAGLMGFISAVPENQRPALFQSLLYEACGRTVNPVHGAVGLLWTGNWNVCQAAVETVFKGGALRSAASFPSSSKSMQSLPGRSQTATQRSKLLLAPEMAAVAQPPPEPSISTARCIEALRPKRPLVESPINRAARGTAAACFFQERPQMLKRHRNSEQGDKVEVGSNCGVAWVPKREPSQEPIFSRERSPPAGLLFSPVARRALPHEDAAEMNQPLRVQASQGVLAGNAEGVQLDLTLNSNPMAPSGRMKLGSVRVSSPSTISVNSEGSVTSLDCSELSMARWPARTPSPSSPMEERELLHLLL